MTSPDFRPQFLTNISSPIDNPDSKPSEIRTITVQSGEVGDAVMGLYLFLSNLKRNPAPLSPQTGRENIT